MEKLKLKITQDLTDVHIYRGVLCVGDAFEIINKIKKGESFYNDSEDEYINPVEKVMSTNAAFKIFSLDHHGGCWTQIFNRENKHSQTEALFIDTGSAHLSSLYRGDKNGSKEHINLINQMIEKSMSKYNNSSKNDKDWPGELQFNSGKLIFKGSGHDIEFYPEDSDIKIDYSQTKEKIFKDLKNLYFEPKCKFINFESSLTDYTVDFCVDDLAWKGSWDMFKIETLEKDVDWLACYYNEFYNDGKNLYEKQKVSVEDAIKLKNWSDQLMGDIFKKSLEETKDSMSEPQIKRYKSYVETYGYTVGYYLAPIDLD